MFINLIFGGGGVVFWGVNFCFLLLEFVGLLVGWVCLGLLCFGCFFCFGFVRFLVDFLVFGFFVDWCMVFLKEGGLWYGGKVLKFFCGFLVGYVEFILSFLVFCVRWLFFIKWEFGLSSIFGCWIEFEGRKKCYCFRDFNCDFNVYYWFVFDEVK